MYDNDPEPHELPDLTLWEQLTIGFPKRRHVYVYRLPMAVALLSTVAAILFACCLFADATGSRLLAATMAAALAAYFTVLYKKTRRCWSIEEAAIQTGRPVNELKRLISTRQIRPEFVVDGRPVYAPSQLSAAATLLRPAGPRAPEGLLRPAGNACDDQNLVRAAGDVEPSRLGMREPESIQLEQRHD
jgi:hypothetical protein